MNVNDLKVIYEDNHIIVVFKPKRIPTQSDESKDLDMVNIIKKYLKEKYDKKGNVFLGLVHRLDRMTFGLMVFAKTSKAASRLSKCIRDREFHKKYLTIVCGNLKGESTLVNYLFKDRKLNKSKVVKNNKLSKEAILDYKVLSNFKFNNDDYSMLSINLKTGRHHQIRVQMSNINHPVYGDIKYGCNKGKSIALCAYYLSFKHPTKDEVLKFKLDNTLIIDEYKLFEKGLKNENRRNK